MSDQDELIVLSSSEDQENFSEQEGSLGSAPGLLPSEQEEEEQEQEEEQEEEEEEKEEEEEEEEEESYGRSRGFLPAPVFPSMIVDSRMIGASGRGELMPFPSIEQESLHFSNASQRSLDLQEGAEVEEDRASNRSKLYPYSDVENASIENVRMGSRSPLTRSSIVENDQDFSQESYFPENHSSAIVGIKRPRSDSRDVTYYREELILKDLEIDNFRTEVAALVRENAMLNEAAANWKVMQNEYTRRLSAQEKAFENIKIQMLEEKDELKNVISGLRAELDDVNSNLNYTKRLHEKEMDQKMLEVRGLKMETINLQEISRKHSEETERLRRENVSLQCFRDELQVAKNKIKELEFEAENLKIAQQSEDSRNNALEIQRLNDQISSLTKEKENWAMEQQSSLLLKNQNALLKRKLEELEKRNQELEITEAKHYEIRAKLQLWIDSMSSTFDSEDVNPTSVVNHILLLRSNVNSGIDMISKLESELKESVLAKENLQRELVECVSSSKSIKAELNEMRETLSTTQTQLRGALHYRDCLTKILDHYDGPDAVKPESQSDSVTQRLKSLSEMLSTNEGVIEKMKSQLAEMDQVKALNRNLTKRVDSLMAEVEILKTRLGRGEYNTSMTKILHFTHNPSMKPRSQNDAMKASSIADINRIKDLEDDRARLEEELLDLKKQKDRLVAIYQSITNDFKEVYFVLFGFSVEPHGKRKYAIKHNYAEIESDYLVFEAPDKKNPKFLVFTLSKSNVTGPILKKYADLLKTHKTDANMFPSLLSKLSLELYENNSRKL